MTADAEITVLVTMSPIPSHPSTEVVEDAIVSVRRYLPTARIVVCADGIRDDLLHRADAYERALDAIAGWDTVELVRWVDWQHQARMVRHALANVVDTPLVLLMEHDTTLQDPIPFDSLVNAVYSCDVNCVRFHHESRVLPAHEHLSVNGNRVEDVCGVPMVATAQYSARPHLADVEWYRWLLGPDHFHPDARVFVEDVAHGVVVEDWRREGRAGWDKHRLWIYAEPNEDGSIQRSNTCDGRRDDPKADNLVLPLEDVT